MAKLATNRIAWLYQADDGTQYRVAAQKAVTDQAKLGGSAGADTDPALPSTIKMRRITLRNNTIGRSRSVPLYSLDAAILVNGATVNLNSGGIVGGNYTEDSYAFMNDQPTGGTFIIQEKHPRKSPVTSQTA